MDYILTFSRLCSGLVHVPDQLKKVFFMEPRSHILDSCQSLCMLHIENNNNKRVKILKSAKKAKDESKIRVISG